MSRIKEPVTQVIRVLRKSGVAFTGHSFHCARPICSRLLDIAQEPS